MSVVGVQAVGGETCKSFLDLVGLGDLGCIDPTEGDSTVELGLPLGGDGAE